MGQSSGLWPRFSVRGVCMWSEAGVGPLPAPPPAFPFTSLSPSACQPCTFPLLSPLPPTVGPAAENETTSSQTPMCTYCCGVTLPQRLILGWVLRSWGRAGREARGQELQEVEASLQRPQWTI